MTGEWELLTPTRIAAALDQFIIGQSEAKKAADRCRKNGNCAAVGKAGFRSVFEGRSDKVHRSRLRWTRCRIDGSRSVQCGSANGKI